MAKGVLIRIPLPIFIHHLARDHVFAQSKYPPTLSYKSSVGSTFDEAWNIVIFSGCTDTLNTFQNSPGKKKLKICHSMDREPNIEKFPSKLLANTPWWIVLVNGTMEENNRLILPGSCEEGTVSPAVRWIHYNAMKKWNVFPHIICAVLTGTYKSR